MAQLWQIGGAPLRALTLASFTVAERRLALPDTAVDLVCANGRVTVFGPMSRARPARLAVGTRALLLALDPLVAAAWLRTPLQLLAIHWCVMKDGLIAEHWANRDDIAMMQQLGLLPQTQFDPARFSAPS